MKAKIFISLLCGLLLGACHNTPRPSPAPPKVLTAPIEQRDVPIFIDAIGQVISPVTVNIRPQVGGKLLSVHVQEGATVREGEVLYTVDPRPYLAILDEAKAQLLQDKALLAYAEQTVERYKSIVDEEFISILTYQQYITNAEAAKARVQLDEAAVIAAQINVDYCSITAPVSGKISYFAIDEGNVVIANDPTALTVIRPHFPIDISFSLPQQYFELIRKEQGDEGHWEFTAALPEKPNKEYEGITYFIDNQINQNTGTILLKGRLPNSDGALWPGEFIKVKVLYRIAPDALLVPPGGILVGREGPYLYTVDAEGKAVQHDVQVIVRTNEYIAFQSAKVRKGDTVIVDGQINIAPGVAVQTIQEAK